MAASLSDPRLLRRLGELGPGSDSAWAAGASIGLGSALAAAFVLPGVAWAYGGLLIRSAIYLWSRDGLRGRGGETLSRLFAFGLVAGAFELIVDYALVHWVSSGKLVYVSGADVVLLASPLYMPAAWACIIVELGYPALRLYGLGRSRLGQASAAVAATVMIALSAAVMVGAYEYLAAAAGWWRYEKARAMLGDYCALFIPAGEFLMFLAVLPLAARAAAEDEKPVAAAIESGSAFALCIAAGYAAAYWLLE